MTLADEQAERLDTLLTAIQWQLDPDLQLTVSGKAAAEMRLRSDEDFREILSLADDLRREMIWPWLAAKRQGAAPGYLGNVNGPGCDPDVP